MTRRTRRIGALVGGAAVLSFAGYAIGSQSGDGVALSKSRAGSTGTSGQPVAFGFAGRDDGLEALADKLGVKAADLKKALADVRKTQKPPAGDPRDEFAAGLASKLGIDKTKVEEALDKQRPKPPAGVRKHRSRMDAALAKELGISAAKVRAAFEKVRPDRFGPGGPGDPDEFLTKLAKEMGVDKDKLEAALQKVHRGGPGGPPGGFGGPGGPPGGPGGPQGLGRPGGPMGPDTAALAKALGVDEADLKTALGELREEHEAEHEKRRNEFAQALADRLGIDVQKVKDALPMGPPHDGRRAP